MPTILHRLSRWADTDPEAVAQQFKRNGKWKPITTRQFMDRVFHLALYLESRGFKEADIGCILAYNCPEWVHHDMAMLLLKGRSAGIYPNSTGKDIHYILNHTQAKILGVQNRDYFQKVIAEEQKLPANIELVLVYDGDTSVHPKAVAYEDALAQGKKLAQGKRLEDYLSALDPKAGSILIYTSGTTGNPKGAILSHDNLVFASDVAARQWRLPMGEGMLFSFLPLCHIAEKLHCEGVGISQRYTVSFCTRFDKLAEELKEVEPTLLLAVPRVWEKMMDAVKARVRNSPLPRKLLAEWAFGVNSRVMNARLNGKMPSPKDLVQLPVADKLVASKIRKAMGLTRTEACASGAAALASHVSIWFRNVGLEILEDYGQTETTGIVCMTERGADGAGTVGVPPTGIEVKLAADGEILTRGRHVFVGYHNNEAATRETLDSDGWLHTGDLGEWDDRGRMRIRGRKKEVLKTSGGKMVAPLPIEEALKASPIISQVCLVGDNRKYLSSLITLKEEVLSDLQKKGGILEGETIRDPEILADVKKSLDGLNSTLASYEQIKRFTVLSREFSIADGEMTPTLKMKRAVVESRFKHLIDQMYE